MKRGPEIIELQRIRIATFLFDIIFIYVAREEVGDRRRIFYASAGGILRFSTEYRI